MKLEVLLSVMNLYQEYIIAITNFDLYRLILIGIGFIITAFLLSKLITYLFNKYYGLTYFSILGFALSTILYFINIDFTFDMSFYVSLIIGIVFFFLTNYLFKVMK